MDGTKRFPLLHSGPLFLECQLQNTYGPLPAGGAGVVCQCGYADLYGCGYLVSSYAFAVEVAFAETAEGGPDAGFWGWGFVSFLSCRQDGDLFCILIYSSVIATSSARLYELTEMIDSHDFTSELHIHILPNSHPLIPFLPETNSEAAIWSSLEANVSIICACLAPLHPLISRIFSFCFRPQPIHSSPATKTHSTTGTHLTSSRKHSIYDQTYHPEGSIYYNDFFYAGPGAYTASISKTNTNEDEVHREGEDEDGIRVVRELRMVSDAVEPGEMMGGFGNEFGNDRDFEMGFRRGSTAGPGNGNGVRKTSIEWDLGDFEFPDYKERMNAPI